MVLKGLLGAGLAASLLVALPARAEEWTKKSFAMPEGAFELTGDPAHPALAGVNLSRNAVGKPLTLTPRVYVGATKDLTLGISHQTGLCLSGCTRRYNDIGFDLIYRLTGSDHSEIDFHGGVPIHSFEPFFVGAQVGLLGRVNLSSIVEVVFDPALYIGLNQRDVGTGSDIPGPGNREQLYLPLWLYFQAADVFVPFIGVGLAGQVDLGLATQVETGMLFDVTEDIDLGFSARLDHADSSFPFYERSAFLLGRFRL